MNSADTGANIAPGPDIADRVREMCGDAAQVRSHYGGLEIRIDHEGAFPWPEVLHALADVHQDIWIRRIDGVLVLRSKPAAF